MGTRAAARDKDMHICTLVRPGSPPIPHVGGPVISPENKVCINGRPASTYGDEAECTGIKSSPPPKDSIIGGCLNVFINGKPAARISEKTYGGKVTEGSPNVNYADKVDKLSEKAANWLHQYLAQQKDIPFDHPWDGCYARAHEMKRIIEEQFNVELKKIFVFGDLEPATGVLHGLSDKVSWGYHVAPMVEGGIGADGNPVQYVIDPSLSPDTVLTKEEWINISKGSGTLDPTRSVMITDGQIYGPSGLKDPTYVDTKATLLERNGMKRDGKYADPDPRISEKIKAKERYPRPVVRAQHQK